MHLIENRSEKEPHLIDVSCQMLINQFIDLYSYAYEKKFFSNTIILSHFLFIISKLLMAHNYGLKKIKLLWPALKLIKFTLRARHHYNHIHNLEISTNLFNYITEMAKIARIIFSNGSKRRKEEMIEILENIINQKPVKKKVILGASISPFQIKKELENNNVDVLGDTFEGLLNVNNIVNYVEPIYHHKLGVRDLIAEKNNFDKFTI